VFFFFFLLAGRRSCGRVAGVARMVGARGRAGQERIRHTGGSELRGRRGLGHQLHRGVRVAIRTGRRQAWQQPDTALGRRRCGKCTLIIHTHHTLNGSDSGRVFFVFFSSSFRSSSSSSSFLSSRLV